MVRAAWLTPLATLGALVVLWVLVASRLPTPEQSGPTPPDDPQASAPVAVTQAAVDEPLDLVPADSLLCWKGLPFPDAKQAPDKPSPFGILIDVGTRLAGNSLDNAQRVTIRILETLGIIGRYPFTVALIDARAKPTHDGGTGRKVDKLRIAAVIKTQGQSEPFLAIIAKAVRELTDEGAAELENKTVGRWSYQELRDSRLPDWCVVAWGEIDEHFVITLGNDVWPLIASTAAGQVASVSQDEWLTKVRQQRPEEPLIEVIVAANDIRERLDPFVQGRATAFFRAWHIADVQCAHWALGFEGRALYCLANYRQPKNTRRRLYADPHIRDERFLQTIPDESRYAIYRLPVATFLPRLISGYYATRKEEERQAAAKLWAKIQADLGIDVERDALAHLGEYIVVHNYPRHPLHLPLAFTSLIEIRDEPAKVRQTLERLLGAWQQAVEKADDETGNPSPLQIRHDDDGVWYLEFPLFKGVAWTFTDRFIVTSWSPIALREYLDKIGDKIGQRQ